MEVLVDAEGRNRDETAFLQMHNLQIHSRIMESVS